MAHLSRANEAGAMIIEEGSHILLVDDQEHPIDIIVWCYRFILQQCQPNLANMHLKHAALWDYETKKCTIIWFGSRLHGICIWNLDEQRRII